MEMIPDQTLKKKKSSGERDEGGRSIWNTKFIDTIKPCHPRVKPVVSKSQSAKVDKKAKSPMWETTSFGLFGETKTLIILVQFPGCIQGFRGSKEWAASLLSLSQRSLVAASLVLIRSCVKEQVNESSFGWPKYFNDLRVFSHTIEVGFAWICRAQFTWVANKFCLFSL